ncbi:MAG TPA: type II and III secretion system protein family protein [Pseudolabrys sp.]|nr:type II and III secretion system protein family protein [Pseudolabrys sp.]
MSGALGCGRCVLLRIPWAVTAVVALAIAIVLPCHAQAQADVEVETAATRHVTVAQHKSVTIRLARPYDSTVVGATDIVDVLPVSDRVIYIQAKKIGTTNIAAFDKSKRLIAIVDIEVTIDTASIADQIRSSTHATGIKVSSSNGQVILSGVANDATVADRAMQIAKAVTPTLPVVNAMSVSAAQQVMLKVRFLEASRTAGRDLGINWFVANSAGNRGINTGLGQPTQVGQSPTGTPGGLPLFQTISTFAGSSTGSPFGVALANLVNNNTARIDVLITALENKGLVRRLAEPDLVALSGDTASFLAGGEVPVPVVQASSSAVPIITVEYKPFGVQLTFVPTVLANGIINLRLAPSVSELDFTNAVVVSGFTIPALTKREARTTIELRDGQSFAIAGLLQSEGNRNVAQVPWVGSVPVLGALFRSTAYQQNETDLVVIVTPHLVQPAAPGQPVATSLDNTLPGNDIDLFLVGQTEVHKGPLHRLVRRGEAEPYGYILPPEPR